MKPTNFVNELRRRHVIRATAGYCFGAWFRFGQLNHAFAALAIREYGEAKAALVAAFPRFGPADIAGDVGVNPV